MRGKMTPFVDKTVAEIRIKLHMTSKNLDCDKKHFMQAPLTALPNPASSFFHSINVICSKHQTLLETTIVKP